MTNYDGKQVLQMMQERSRIRKELQNYFRRDCKLWRAIEDHIAHSKDCVVINRESNIQHHRGTGPAISLEKFNAYHEQIVKDNKFGPPTHFWLQIRIGYYCDDGDNERYGDEWYRSYDFWVPIDLLTDFSQEKFGAWIAELREKRDVLRQEKDFARLKELVARYPEETLKLLKE